MRVLVTGGAGFIGANLVHLLRAERPTWQVTVLDALTYAGNRASLAPVAQEVTFVHGDVRDAALVDRLVADADAVVHLAAESHNDRSLGGPEAFVATNVVGTFTVLEAVRRHGVRLHHVSTDEVYGDLPLESTERFSAASPYNPSSPYSATKAGSDLLVRAWVRSYGVAATITCGGNTYGPYQHVEKLVPRTITALFEGVRPRVYGTGANVRDWVHVSDHARALLAVLERGEVGRTYLVGAGTERSNLDVVRTVLEVMGRPPGDYDLVADRPGHDRRYALDAAALRDELGWRPRHPDLRAGLAETVAWYRANEDWWRAQRAESEAWYAASGR